MSWKQVPDPSPGTAFFANKVRSYIVHMPLMEFTTRNTSPCLIHSPARQTIGHDRIAGWAPEPQVMAGDHDDELFSAC